MAEEWIRLTPPMESDSALRGALEQFQAPDSEAGRAAEEWLKGRALTEADHIATWVRFDDGHLTAFHSLSMGEVELQTRHRKRLRASHVRQGAVLILWMARSADASVDATEIVMHAVGLGRIAARLVGAVVIAADPYDAGVEQVWRDLGFRTSSTPQQGRRRREAQAALGAALTGLGVLLASRFRGLAGSVTRVFLGLARELGPALVLASLGQLILIKLQGLVQRLFRIGGGSKNVALTRFRGVTQGIGLSSR